MPRRNRRFAGAGVVGFLFVFVALMAAFMGAVAFSSNVDLANRLIALGIFVALMVWVVAFGFGLRRAVVGPWMTRRRWRRFNVELGTMGFREATPREVNHTLRIPVQLLAPGILAEQRGGGIDHVKVGVLGGQEARCFNVRVRGGGWTDVPAVALRANGTLSPTLIMPVAKVAIRPRPGMQRVRFELEEFNRCFTVFSTDPFFASALIDARMISWIQSELFGAVIEVSDRWVVFWCLRRSGRHLGPRDLIDLLVGFDENMPRSIPSLFPEGPVELQWRPRKERAIESRR